MGPHELRRHVHARRPTRGGRGALRWTRAPLQTLTALLFRLCWIGHGLAAAPSQEVWDAIRDGGQLGQTVKGVAQTISSVKPPSIPDCTSESPCWAVVAGPSPEPGCGDSANSLLLLHRLTPGAKGCGNNGQKSLSTEHAAQTLNLALPGREPARACVRLASEHVCRLVGKVSRLNVRYTGHQRNTRSTSAGSS